jgi:vancomycin resistance protein YoaR
MAEYRRRVFLTQFGPPALSLIMATVIFTAGTAVWEYLVLPTLLPQSFIQDSPLAMIVRTVPKPAFEKTAVAAGTLVAPTLTDPTTAGQGRAYVGAIGGSALTNMRIAMSFVDGTVIPPGEQFSFDDEAESWDFRENAKYLPSLATSARGPIVMRGGGVCWVSTAIWRAALEAGIATDYRENHFGFVAPLGAGLDATNTLVIRNNSSVPLTVKTWEEGGYVVAELVAGGKLDRTAEVSAPKQVSKGNWVTYQTVRWDDGDVTTQEFYSHYYW